MKKLLYLFVFLIPVLVLLVSLRLVAFNTAFYDKEFNKLGVYDRLGNESVKGNANEIIDYLKGKGSLDTSFFNEREIAHMKDVKNLVNNGYVALTLLAITIVVFIVSMFVKRDYGFLGKIIVYSGLLGLAVIFLFLAAISLDFTGIFNAFHIISFDNDLWLLNPETDKLIGLFPEAFFYDASLMIIYLAASIFLASIVLGIILLRYSRKH